MDWNKWAAIGQLAGAVGTFAAVLTSLYLSRRAERPKLKLIAGVRLIVDPDADGDFPKVIDTTVRNAGTLTAHVSQYGWRTGRWRFKWPNWLARQHAIQQPGQLGLSFDPPFELPPGQRRTTLLGYDNFMHWIGEKKGEPFFARVWPVLGLRRTAVWTVAYLESGVSIIARVEPDLAEDLFQAEARRLAQLKPNASGGESNG